MPRRHYSLEEANLLVPKLAAIMRRVVQLHGLLDRKVRVLGQAGQRVDQELLSGARSSHPREGTEGDLEQAKALHAAFLQEVVAIEALGAEIKGADKGLVDVWSYLDGETEVLLCWKLGEPRFAHYHTTEAGFAGRQPVGGHLFSAERDASPRRPDPPLR